MNKALLVREARRSFPKKRIPDRSYKYVKYFARGLHVGTVLDAVM